MILKEHLFMKKLSLKHRKQENQAAKKQKKQPYTQESQSELENVTTVPHRQDILADNDQEQTEKEFSEFFAEVLKKFPQQTANIILKGYDKARGKAEQLLAKSQANFTSVFQEFLGAMDAGTQKKCQRVIHAAALTAAIVGCSPIAFSDAILLVPIQLTMLTRLHKIFGRPWSEHLGRNLSRELIIISLGKSTAGNLLKLVPVVGTVSGAAINATVALTITEALGWTTVKMLNDGEDIFGQVMSFKGQFFTLFNALQQANKRTKK